MFSPLVIIAVVLLIVASAALVFFLVRRSDSGIVYHNDGFSDPLSSAQKHSSASEPQFTLSELGLTPEEIARLQHDKPEAVPPPEGLLVVKHQLVNNVLEQALQQGKDASGLITRFNGQPAFDVRKIADPEQRAKLTQLIHQLNEQTAGDLDLKEAFQIIQYISKQL
jgi:hypothetical protein